MVALEKQPLKRGPSSKNDLSVYCSLHFIYYLSEVKGRLPPFRFVYPPPLLSYSYLNIFLSLYTLGTALDNVRIFASTIKYYYKIQEERNSLFYLPIFLFSCSFFLFLIFQLIPFCFLSLWRTPFSYSFRGILLVINSLVFIHLRMSCFHLKGIFTWYRILFDKTFFQHLKNVLVPSCLHGF